MVQKKKIRKAKRQEISKELLEVICCPIDKGDLNYKIDESRLVCKKCKRNYEVKNGIPVLLPN